MTRSIKILLFYIGALTPVSGYAQFLDPNTCKLWTSDNYLEKRITFCQLTTDSSKEVYQVKPVVLIDTEGVTRYNLNTKKWEHELFKGDTINAYLISGIYRSYYLTDTLKIEGILTTRPLITDEHLDTFLVHRADVKIGDNFINWDYSKHAIKDLDYGIDLRLYRLGEWSWYYENGQLKSKGQYVKYYYRAVHYSDDECKGGPRTDVSFVSNHKKDGIWYQYDSEGKLTRKYVPAWDDEINEWIEVEIE
ncbi:MAG: hypothetical protein JKY52_15930 [Flavobacteriales bacterium]|nr:hypothetical protein [Flavobacteriales bacterium]